MSNLGPQYQNLSYGSLLQVSGGVTSTLQPVTDGNGNATGLSLSLTSVGISGLTANTASNIAGGAPGAVLYQSASGITGFTPIGISGQVLASNATGQPYWTSTIPQATLAGSCTAIVGGSPGALPYQSSANVTSFTSVGDAGQVLVSNGSSAPSWSNYAPNAFLSTSAFSLQGGFAGSLVYQSNSNVTNFISPGTSGQYLQASGSAAPAWVTLTPGSIGALPIDGSLSMNGSLSLGGNRVVSLATPIYNDDAATKSYVDNAALGLNLKSSCVAATTANITLSGAQTIDGVSCIAGNRVLVKNQTSQADNGIYVVSTGAWGRSSDANTWISLVGATTFITGGTTQISTTWSSTISSGGTLGTTPITFAQFAGSQTYSAGTGLSLVGNTFSLITPVSSATNINAGVAGDLLYQSAAGTTSKLNISSTGFILVSDGTKPVWGLVAPYATNIQNGAYGSVVYQSGSSTTSFLPIGTNNYVLTSDGTKPIWALPQSSNTPNSLTFNSSGLGGSSPVSFNGSVASTISYNTIGAAATNGTNAIGTWPISISGTATNATSAISITGTSGVTAGSYANPTIVVNSQGLITSATAGSSTGGGRVGNYVSAGYNAQGFAGGTGGVLVGGGYSSQPNGAWLSCDGAANWLVAQVSKNYNPSELIIYSTSGQGYVNVSGTSVSLITGSNFDSTWISGWNANTTIIYIGDQRYTIASINSPTSLTLTTNAGIQSNVAYNFFYTSGSGTCTVSGTSSGTLTFVDGDPFVNIPGFLNGSFLLNNQVVSTSFNSASSVNYYGYSGVPPSTSSFKWRGNINNQISTFRVQSIQGAQEENVNLMALAAGENGAGSTINGDGRCFVLCTGIAGSYGKYRPILIGSGDWGSYNYQYQLGVYPPNSNGYSNGYVELGGVNGKGMLKVFAPYYRTVNNTWFEIVATGTSNGNPRLAAESISADCSLTLAPKGNGGVQIIQANLQNYTQIGCSAAGYLYGVSSDATKKNVIGKIDSALTKINSLSGVTFTWKNQELYGFGNKVGLIAQEVKEVIPEIVNESPDGHMSVDYSNLTAVLVESIKELTARLEVLENGK